MMDEVEPAAEDVDVLAGLCGGERMFVDDDAAAGGAPELPQPGNNGGHVQHLIACSMIASDCRPSPRRRNRIQAPRPAAER